MSSIVLLDGQKCLMSTHWNSHFILSSSVRPSFWCSKLKGLHSHLSGSHWTSLKILHSIALWTNCENTIFCYKYWLILSSVPEDHVALFDMPNSNWFDILSISIFSEISLSISISIFSKISLSISISISIFSKTSLSISILMSIFS